MLPRFLSNTFGEGVGTGNLCFPRFEEFHHPQEHRLRADLGTHHRADFPPELTLSFCTERPKAQVVEDQFSVATSRGLQVIVEDIYHTRQQTELARHVLDICQLLLPRKESPGCSEIAE